MNTAERNMIWLDTDIGTDIDDALALSYLLARPDVELVGISTVTLGAVARARLAAAICREMGQPNLRVFAGTEHPLLVPHVQTTNFQTDAVDAAMTEAVAPQVATTGAAVEAMYRALLRWPRQIHLLGIGPMTNLALLVRTHPDAAELPASVTFMAGQYFGPANPEWNVRCDPHAMAIVLEVFRNIRAVGLDVTLQTSRQAKDIWKIFEPAGSTVRRAIDIFVEHKKRDFMWLHDPLAAACLLDDQILHFERGEIVIETNSGVAQGVALFRGKPDGPHLAARTVDVDRFTKHYEKTMTGFQAIGQ